VAERPRRLALELAWDNLRLLAILGLFALIMITVLIVLMMRQFIKPVRHMVRVAQAIEKGDLKRRTALDRKDEVGELSRAFDRMTQRLSRSMENLEREVAERKRAEEELRSSTQRLSLHMENTPLAVIEWDVDSKITQWNPAAEKIFGYQTSEVLGKTSEFLFMPGKDLEEARRYWIRLFKEQAEKHVQLNMATQKGESKLCDLFTTLLRDAQGNIAGMACLLQDISHRAMLEQQLRQAQKMEAMGTLAGGIAHDFNNILSAITGYSELALDEIESGNPSPNEIRQILKAADRAKVLIQQILAFSRKAALEMIPVKSQPGDRGQHRHRQSQHPQDDYRGFCGRAGNRVGIRGPQSAGPDNPEPGRQRPGRHARRRHFQHQDPAGSADSGPRPPTGQSP
jgi:PAS domain S-box-containing protein